MSRTPRLREINGPNGITVIVLSSWRYFTDYILQEMLDYRSYIWRGQRCANWRPEPTLDRQLKGFGEREQRSLTQKHLEKFKYAIRGRRGPNPSQITNENDWWAMGQHHGLNTPLLDWTGSPFVSAYFAFIGTGIDQSSRRAIFALSQKAVRKKSNEIQS